MSHGVKVWDSSGQLTLDSSILGGRILGSVDASAASGSVSHPGLTSGRPFALPILNMKVLDLYSNELTPAATVPKVTFSGLTMSWTRQVIPGEELEPCTLYFGVY